jgi:hypothetical protein
LNWYGDGTEAKDVARGRAAVRQIAMLPDRLQIRIGINT